MLTVTNGTTTDTRSEAFERACHAVPTAHVGEVMRQVIEFHEAFNLPRQPLPDAHVGDVLAQLRVRLLREETEEFAEGTDERDVVPIADALADVVYVAYGSALTYGIDLDAVIREVHRSNMSKLDVNGQPLLRSDGKVLKSTRYSPPALASVLQGQLPLFADTGARSEALTS
ncbi:nucleoside triphosphate pyrophosphohydrolase family protein [Nocardioides sp. G10]|uniref:Nucleoside triphosphate pyrophosphohydrolase family protein n=2 Tax=Nocardioides baculatus TaxID=2801337 RepID=A0ABS1L5C0_9ACTN|nr:nucleoside triphosphate pyrophosphohydrolase family protein [Nocardioides baculatus]